MDHTCSIASVVSLTMQECHFNMPPTDFEVSTDKDRIDVDMVHEFLSSSYGAEGRSSSVVEKTIQNSLCFGGYVDRRQVAFGRVVTDYAVFGYIMDMFVLPQYRGRGFATAIMRAMLDHPDLEGIQTLLLRSRDSRAFYERFGFCPVPRSREMIFRRADG